MEILLFKNKASTFQNVLLHFKMGILLFKNGDNKFQNWKFYRYFRTCHFIVKLTVGNVEFTDYFFRVKIKKKKSKKILGEIIF